jgi:aspartate/methionine/tyrosine aminotransferase
MDAVQSPIIPVIGELIRQHPGTISLGQGIVYYPPPPEAMAFLPKFLEDFSNHQYKAVIGIPPLREAIAQKLWGFNRIAIDQQNCVVVTAGSNMAFMNAVLAITKPGDEIILQKPYYFNHEMAVTIAGCRPILVATDENYQLQPDAIAQAVTAKTRAIVTISPNNPTGAVYSRAALQAVNQLCGDRGIYHISDEAYEYFTYGGVEHVSPGAFLGSNAHTISLFSLSKAYGFAGWRIGYMVIPAHLLEATQKVQDTILICPPVVSQFVALGALQVGESYCRQHIQEIIAVRKLMLDALATLQGICTIAPADGAFYFLLRVHTDLSALTVAERLIREHGVAVIPGGTFGMEEGCYLRVAYGALQKETAATGIERLVVGLKAIVG